MSFDAENTANFCQIGDYTKGIGILLLELPLGRRKR
jgi:hypothetical protein